MEFVTGEGASVRGDEQSYAQLQTMYGQDEYYWGMEPNGFTGRALKFMLEPDDRGAARVVDIGAGEGRDAVFFAEQGLDVLAQDVSPNGLEKAKKLAHEKDVEIRVLPGDINVLELTEDFDLVYSIGTIQYIHPANRRKRLEHFKERTVPGGLHAVFAFVDHPDIPPAPDLMADEYLYAQGELPSYYAGWECLHQHSFVFDDDSEGIPHQHAAEEYVFKKPA